MPVFSLQSGLTIYKSPFLGVNDRQGVVGGPHHVITEIDKVQSKSKMCQYAYFTDQCKVLISNSSENSDSSLSVQFPENMEQNSIQNLLCWEDHDQSHIQCASCHVLSSKRQKQFEDVENAASEILYRCVNCRNCQNCKNGERIEYISVKE